MNTLYTKLALGLFGLFCLVGGVFVAITVFTAQMYQQEVTQKLNRKLAENIVAENVLFQDGEINHPVLEEIFHTLMVINPSIELYLLDPEGEVVAFSAPEGKVLRRRVSLQPLHQAQNNTSELPLMGDDPRSLSAQKAFSVAPIHDDQRLVGFLYIILESEEVDGIVDLLNSSYILRLSTWLGVASVVFALAAGLLTFALLTRRLRALSAVMAEFRRSDFHQRLPFKTKGIGAEDEIDRLGDTFSEMAERIWEQLGKLRKTDALRRELLANVSHDLRTPLASLQGYIETLLVKDESLSMEKQREYLQIAARHTRHLGKLIQELFELSKLESRETDPSIEPFSLTELIQDVAQKFELRAQRKGITIETDFQTSTPFVEGDIAMIERVLDNLIENAIRHTPRDGSIRLSLIPDDDRLSIRVADTGCGIPPEELPHIFERFHRHVGGGSGLGLAIAWRIVELHGSVLTVHSTPDRGTRFDFWLPMHRFANP